LEELDYTIEYKAGKKDVNADTLSSNPMVMTALITSEEKKNKKITRNA